MTHITETIASLKTLADQAARRIERVLTRDGHRITDKNRFALAHDTAIIMRYRVAQHFETDEPERLIDGGSNRGPCLDDVMLELYTDMVGGPFSMHDMLRLCGIMIDAIADERPLRGCRS